MLKKLSTMNSERHNGPQRMSLHGNLNFQSYKMKPPSTKRNGKKPLKKCEAKDQKAREDYSIPNPYIRMYSKMNLQDPFGHGGTM